MHIKTLKFYLLTCYYLIFWYIDITVRCYSFVKCIYLFRYCFEIKIFKIPSGLFELHNSALLSILHIMTQHTRISYPYLTLLLYPLDPFFPATLWGPCCHFRDQRHSSKLSQMLGVLPRGTADQMTTLEKSHPLYTSVASDGHYVRWGSTSQWQVCEIRDAVLGNTGRKKLWCCKEHKVMNVFKSWLLQEQDQLIKENIYCQVMNTLLFSF